MAKPSVGKGLSVGIVPADFFRDDGYDGFLLKIKNY
jgi:hypothetical protein